MRSTSSYASRLSRQRRFGVPQEVALLLAAFLLLGSVPLLAGTAQLPPATDMKPSAVVLTAYDTGAFGTYANMGITDHTSWPVATASLETSSNLPTLGSSWTIEGWLWNCGSNTWTLDSGSSAAIGVLSGNLPQPDKGQPKAGLYFGGLGPSWVWPSGTNPSVAGPLCQNPDTGPVHFALEWTGSKVAAYVNGALDSGFPVSTSTAGIGSAAPGGFINYDDLNNPNFDDFRISSVARYVDGAGNPLTSFSAPAQPFTSDSSTALLWHLDSALASGTIPVSVWCNGGGQSQPQTFSNFSPDSSGNNNPAKLVLWPQGGICGNPAGGQATVQVLFRGQALSAQELLSPDEAPNCHCSGDPVIDATGELRQKYTDLSIPGRGYRLAFSRTYSSALGSQGQDSPLGLGWTDNYNAYVTLDQSNNVTVHEENGSTTSFVLVNGSYKAPGRVLASLVHGSGSYTFTRHDLSKLVFSDSTLKLTSEIDRNGYTTTLAYSGGLLATVTDQAGRQLGFTYWPGTSHIQTITDPANRQLTFTYSSNDLTTVKDLAGDNSSYSYSNHLLTNYQDPKCYAANVAHPGSCPGLQIQYNGSSPPQVTSETDSLGRQTQFAYNQSATDLAAGSGSTGGWTKITDPNGNVEMQHYIDGLLLADINAYGTSSPSEERYQYDPATLSVTARTDGNGNVWRKTYDSSANVLTSTDPLNRTTSYTYNSFNEPLTATDPLNVTTTYTYDANGNLTQSSRPLNGSTNQVTKYAYDSGHPGDLTTLTDPNNHDWQYAYDTYGNRIKSIDPAGDTTTYSYDNVGRLTSSVRPIGNVTGGNPSAYTTSYTFNAFGDHLSVTDPLGHKTSYVYDQNRNRTSLTDATNHTTTYVYDFDNELTQVTRPDNSTLKAGYDANGNVTSQTNGLNNSTTYAYDPLNRRTSSTDPVNRKTTYAYDASGNLTSLVDAMNRTTTYGYDAANQLNSITYSDGKTPNVSFTYDSDGRRLTMADGTGTSTYTYDHLNRLTQSVDGSGASVGYGYDLAGHLTTLAYPGGSSVTRGYDSVGRLTSVQDWLSHSTTFSYDANSNLTTESFPNNTTGTFTYDAADQLTGISYKLLNLAPFLSLSYTRDNANQLSSENTQTYGNDSVNRLTTVGTGTGGQSVTNTSYTYDAGDNLTQITQVQPPTSTTTQAFDAANQLCWRASTSSSNPCSTPPAGATTYTYDANGNRTGATASGNTTGYAFDQANRLTSYGSSAAYAYNGDGLRTSKTVSGSSDSFVWDIAEGAPLVIKDGATSYVTGPSGLPLEQVASSGVTYYHEDQLGSVRAITDTNGSSVATYAYDVYGNVTSSTGSLANPFKFAGQYVDSESGLYYMRARYYDPVTAQFMSVDPLQLVTRERYAYVSDSPLNRVDPSGLDDTKEGATTPEEFQIIEQFRPLTADEQDQMTIAQTEYGLQEGDSVQFNCRNAARQAFMNGSDLQRAANRFFKGATSKYQDFSITRLSNGNYEFRMTAPANNPGYTKIYMQEVDESGNVVNEFKDTNYMDQNIERKWLRKNGIPVGVSD